LFASIIASGETLYCLAIESIDSPSCTVCMTLPPVAGRGAGFTDEAVVDVIEGLGLAVFVVVAVVRAFVGVAVALGWPLSVAVAVARTVVRVAVALGWPVFVAFASKRRDAALPNDADDFIAIL
jgi:hypothetical protein